MRLIIPVLWILFALPTATAQMTTTGLPEGAEGWYLPTRDGAGELFVYELGDGDPVVVLHGGPGADSSYLLPVARGLEDRFRFVFYDQRGSLRSRVDPESISMDRHVDDLDTLREALGVERIRILSHSAGTLLAFEYLVAHGGRVRELVLSGALPHKNGRRYFDAEYAALWRDLAEDARQFAEREEITAELRRAGLESPSTAKERAQAAIIRQIGAETVHVERWRQALPMRVNPEAARRTRETTDFEYDHSSLLADHPFQITVINGEFDYTVGPRGSPLWRRLVETRAPRVALVVVPDASHIVWRDAPEAFRAALGNALSGER